MTDSPKQGRPRGADWHAEARELRAQGWTLERIGRRLGVSKTAVCRATNPSSAEANRLRAGQRYRDNPAAAIEYVKKYRERAMERRLAVAREYGATL